ncbi:hypothetical protein D1007_46272 [Hordeum vulgare]|nr:hypothetical protein D1007_46272 [Hordeum vulgare]
MASVRKFVNGGENLEGNLPLLQMWYYEKWRVHQLDSTISYASRLRPLIQNWSDEKAQKVDNIINKNSIGVGEYVDDLLRPFNPPPVRTPFKPKIDGKDKAVIGCVLAYLKEGASIDEEDRVVAAASKESLKNVSQLDKELDASQDPLNLRHNKNVRKSEEKINQDDEDFSIEVGKEAAKQQKDSVVDSMLPTRASSRKRVVSSLLSNEDYVLYDSDKKRKKNRTPSESTNDSKNTKNTKRKNCASNLKDTDIGASRLETDLDKFRQIYVAEIINTSDLDEQLVVIDDIVLLQKHLQCLTMTDRGEDDKWLGDEVVDAVIEIMRHDHPKNTRDRQLVYIERVVGIAMLERNGKVENCHEAPLAHSHGTTKGDNYLRHDLVFLPTNSVNTHWFIVVVNPKTREIQILDSLFSYVVRTQVVQVVRF